ncbi:hypothetical protein KY310_03415 [Candidatus Woesearchaeota archaeon]|nr:hypothetical protein [Candidatus Woesearchaeota archaeon]
MHCELKMDPFKEKEVDALIEEIAATKQLDWRNRDGLSYAVKTLYDVLPEVKGPMHKRVAGIIEDLARHVLYRVHDNKTVAGIAKILGAERWQKMPPEFEPTEEEEALVCDKEAYHGSWGRHLAFVGGPISGRKAYLWRHMNASATDYARISLMWSYEQLHEVSIANLLEKRDHTKKAEEAS